MDTFYNWIYMEMYGIQVVIKMETYLLSSKLEISKQIWNICLLSFFPFSHSLFLSFNLSIYHLSIYLSIIYQSSINHLSSSIYLSQVIPVLKTDGQRWQNGNYTRIPTSASKWVIEKLFFIIFFCRHLLRNKDLWLYTVLVILL